MHATHPSTPEPAAAWAEFGQIKVTRKVEHDEQPTPDSWQLICVPAHAFDSCQWLNKLLFNVAGISEDGESYEVVIPASFVQYLFYIPGCEQSLNYDPMAPEADDIERYGLQEATKRRHARFLRNAASRIRSCRGYEECCRDRARVNRLGLELERALLIYDVLVSSSLFGFQTPLTFLRNLIHVFASVLRNTFSSLV